MPQFSPGYRNSIERYYVHNSGNIFAQYAFLVISVKVMTWVIYCIIVCNTKLFFFQMLHKTIAYTASRAPQFEFQSNIELFLFQAWVLKAYLAQSIQVCVLSDVAQNHIVCGHFYFSLW